MHRDYEFQGKRFEVHTTPCDDGDVVLTIGNFPVSFTVYLSNTEAGRLADQILQASVDAMDLKAGLRPR